MHTLYEIQSNPPSKKQQRRKSYHAFKIGEYRLKYSSFYKYLGVLYECSIFKNNAANLVKSFERALGAIVTKMYTNTSVGFRTYEKMYLSGVTPIWTTAVEYEGMPNIMIFNMYNIVHCGIFWVCTGLLHFQLIKERESGWSLLFIIIK